jgi:hypothetical protein
MKTKIKSTTWAALLSLPFIGMAAPQGQTNSNTPTLDSEHQANVANIVNRNQDNVSADPTAALPEWLKKITISGLLDPSLNFGFGKRPLPVGVTTPPQQGSTGPSQSAVLNAAELYIDAQVADWVLVHTTFAYDTDFNNAGSYISGTGANQPQTLFVEEGSVTLANFNESPFWLTAGRQFLLFGSYKHSTVNRPITQYLSEANNVAVTVGAVQPMGELNFYGDMYTFQGVSPTNQNPVKQQIKGFGANVGLNKNSDVLGYNFNAGFINNMMNNYFVGNACNPLLPGITPTTCNSGYTKKVPGLSLHFDANSGPFSLSADYVEALTSFSGQDLPSGANPISTTSPGAKPWAYALESTYNFPSLIRHKTYDSRVFAGFQQSGDAVNVSSATVLGGYWTPRYRYVAGYGIDLIKNLTVRIQFQHDTDYSTAQGGTGANNNAVFTDLKVVF